MTLGSVSLLTAEGQELLIVHFNDNGTAAAAPLDMTLHAIFEERAAKTPERLSIVCGESPLTY
ncbi:hypothetical protein DQX05_21755 [Paenibacillus thiaminolyticus]|uniref:Uncharacterized protein n=1 Tax=Paenibacillus thiaminolyticus TaxID=49283 RepID=A0A3A3GCD0_PANTH|nr:hypothetical protein DQX05_21755 [Paenibacillus thiaminolyticus]